jgi:sporulation protein YlmC with PRC-barrel domain
MKTLAELLGTKVRTESGRELGRIHDVRAVVRARSATVTGLCVGKLGLLERLGVGAPESRGRSLQRDVVPWRAVVRADKRGVIVRDEVQP